MHALGKIRTMMQDGTPPHDLKVLQDLVAALDAGEPFPLSALYDIDMQAFRVALELLDEWRLGHLITGRGELVRALEEDALPA